MNTIVQTGKNQDLIRLEEHANSVPQERQQLEQGGTLHWFHWVIVGSPSCSPLARGIVHRANLKQKLSCSLTEADQVVDLVIERMGTYKTVLWSGVGLIQSTRAT